MQQTWRYINESGQMYNVGIYHGEESKHVLIYCNNDILTIDFSIAEDKDYSFYLEKDLCKLSIKTENSLSYEYDFTVNDKSELDFREDSHYSDLDYVSIGLSTLFFVILFASIVLSL